VRSVRRLLASAAAALSLEMAAAQDAASPELKPRFNGTVEIGVADKYIYHGYVLENQGAIIQPEIEASAHFYPSGSFLTKISFRLYVFSSFQLHESREEETDAMVRSWYELNFETGIVVEFASRFTFSASYVRFQSPNNAFIAANAAEFVLTVEDIKVGGFVLNPHVTWFRPFPGGWESSDEGSYFELGIEPERTFGKSEWLTLGFPITVGLGQKRYYLGEHFGFFSAGVAASVPLSFLPPSLGKWNLGVSATYYRLGRNTADFSNDGNRNESVVSVTLGTEF
jgi:hypothetical protein